MKKFFKLVAVVLAIAVIICPMMIFAETSTSSGTYKIALVDANTVQLTINSTDGFVAYHAIVGFNRDDAFQSSYNDDGYVDGLKVISYTLKTEQANDHNTPTIRAHASGTSLNVIVMPSDTNNLDLCTKIVIGIRVASGATASLTKIQAADNGTVDSEDANLLTFPAAGSDGVIDTNANDYDAANAVTHVHTVVEDAAVAPTCTETGLTAGSHCSVCNEVLVAQTVVPALGHSFTNYVSDGNATCTADGTKTAACDRGCGVTNTITDEGSALGHNMIHHDAASSTCLVQGNIEYYSCSRCNKLFANESGATELTAEQIKTALAAHTPSTAVVENDVASTCTTAGHYQEVVYCSVCGVELSRDTYNKELKAHSYGEWTTDADGHSRTCSVCGTVESGEHDGNPCSVCGYEAQAVCTHNYVGVVTTQPTKTSTGVMTYTCTECGDSYTEDIAIPAVISTKMLNPSLYFASSVGMKLAVNTNALSSLGYSSTYTIVCNYQEYATGYVLQDAQTVFPSSAYDNVAKGFIFTSLPLTQMCEDVEFTIYCQNANGVVTGYYTVNSSIISLALSYANKYSSDVKLLKTLADMVNYGDAAQQYFAAQNPGTAIASAESPITLFGDYVLNASSVEDDMPESFTTTKQETKNLATTGLAVSPTMLIGASNSPKFTIKVPYSYDLSKLTVSISYTDSYNAEQSVNVSGTDLTFVSDNTAKQFKTYSIVFDKLALCDLQKVLTVQICNEEVLEYTYNYSLGAYINQYIGYEQLRPLLTHAVLFANSAYDKLIVG